METDEGAVKDTWWMYMCAYEKKRMECELLEREYEFECIFVSV